MPPTPKDHLLRNLLRQVEPLTRYEAGDLPVRDRQDRTTNGTLVHMDRVAIEVVRSRHAGELPRGVVPHDREAEMEQAAAKECSVHKAEARERLRTWTQAHGQAILVPEVEDVFGEAQVHGHQHRCGTCQGHGQVSCGPCGGHGSVTCTRCHGSGRLNCHGCHGIGMRWEMVRYHVPATPGHVGGTTIKNEYKTCSVCNGRRYDRCSCNNGHVTCTTCHGNGKVPCNPCAATGMQHERMEVRCKVERGGRATAEDPRPEVQEQVGSWRLKDLVFLTDLSVQEVDLDVLTLRRRFTFTLETPQLVLGTPGGDLTIIGYGAEARITDLKGVVGRLLEGDVAGLEEAIASEGRWPWQRCVAVEEHLDHLLASEAHQQIAAAGFRSDDAQVKELVESGLVAGDHAKRVGTAVRQAVRKIASPPLLKWVLPVALIPALALAIGRVQQVSWIWTVPVLLGSIVVAWLCWWLVERLRTRALVKAHPAIEAKRFRQIVKGQRPFKRWRWATLGLAVVCWALAFKYVPKPLTAAQRYAAETDAYLGRPNTSIRVPDRFTWVPFAEASPAVQDALAGIAANTKVNVLDQARQAVQLGCAVHVATCDLDGDGVPGYALSYANCDFWCGARGCAIRVYEGARRIDLVDHMEQVKPAGGGVMTSKGVFVGL